MSLSADKTDFGAAQRARALADLMVLDTPDEQAFDDLVFVAAKACDVPIALITLLDTDRQWFKAKYGLEVCETEIEHSVCRIEIDQGDLLDQQHDGHHQAYSPGDREQQAETEARPSFCIGHDVPP